MVRSLMAVVGNAGRQNRVARFRRGDQVADRADPTRPRHQRGHFVKRPAFAELFKASELRHVKSRIRDLPLLVEMNRDLPVAFDPRHRIDNYRLLTHRFFLSHPSPSLEDRNRKLETGKSSLRVRISSFQFRLFVASRSKPRLRHQLGTSPFQNIRQHHEDGVGRGRAPGDVDVDVDKLVDRPGLSKQCGNS